MWLEFWRVLPPEPMPTWQDKVRAGKRLDQFVRPQSATLARFVLAETKDQAEKKRTAHRVLESKATSVIGFATAVLGFTAAFNTGALTKVMLFGWLPLIAPALILEAVAILAGVMVLLTQSYALPDAVLFNYHETVEDPMNEARIAMALAQAWGKYEKCLDVGNDTRSRRLSVAIWTFVFGLFYSVSIATADVVAKQHAEHVGTSAANTSPGPKNSHQPTSQGKGASLDVKVGSGSSPHRTHARPRGTP
jgi:hypothetical protein